VPAIAAPARAPASTVPPLSVLSPLATLTGTGPPSAGSATRASALPASSLISTVNAYYALIGQRRLGQAWDWLSPAFQQRIGSAYYYRFWEGISKVDLLSVRPQTGAVALQIRYVETNGTVSTEWAEITFAVDPATNRILIDGYRVTG
jgi:hypothetical protein